MYFNISRNIRLSVKRFFDILVCGIILIIGFPILVLLGILVKLSSPGSLFFIQTRVGKDEKLYRIIKFRTMKGEPDKGATRWTKSDEKRITPIGHFLRDYGLDELPQLINIIKGDMSIIGPRTPLPQQMDALQPGFRKMFEMRPGVLSLAAIEGRRSLTMEQRYALHTQYVDTWSLMLDIKILWRCLFVVLRRESATEKTCGE